MTRVARRILMARLLAVAVVAGLAARAPAQEVAPPPGQEERPPSREERAAKAARIAALEARAFDAIEAEDYAAAEASLRELVELDSENFVPPYNLACVRALRGDGEEAISLLERAISLGFVDLGQMEQDPNLSSIRGHPRFRRIVGAWGGVLEAHLEANLAIVEKAFGPRYTVERDPALRLAYASAFDPTSFEQAREEIRRVSDWALENIFPELAAPGVDAWVVVVLPTRKDFERWAIGTFGREAISDFRQIGGSYDHDAKRLVAQDLGATLRHEFLHVLHWRSNTRTGHLHAIWVQEGLCSLLEDYDLDVRGSLVPAPSWRTNIVKRLRESRRLPTLKELVSMPRERFGASRPLQRYAHARAVFLFLHEEGKLRAWYEAYDRGYAQDPTGAGALEEVFGMDLVGVEERFRAWIDSLPEVPEEISPGMASLGVEIDPGLGEGPVIAEVVRRSAAAEAGLKRGDILTHIGGRSTRDLYELVRVLASFEPGQEVEVRVRRGTLHLAVRMALDRR